MNDIFLLILSFSGGLAAGVIFFGGLWLTVRNIHKMNQPAPIIFLSFVGRVAAVLGIFWLLTRGDLLHLAFCLFGFLVARFFFIRAIRKGDTGNSVLFTDDNNKPCT